MSNKQKILRNIVIIVISIIIYIKANGLYLFPKNAFEDSEKTMHIGPSEIYHIRNYEKGKYYLGKYDSWVTCINIIKSHKFFYRFGSGSPILEYDINKSVDYNWHMSHEYLVIYGIVNDEKIEKLEIFFENGNTVIIDEFYDDLFIFERYGEYLTSIKGYDNKGELLYDSESY